MRTGECALCGTVGKLHDSHFLPKSVYRLMRESNNGNNSPVLISHQVSIQSDYQMKQPLLCSACERRFSLNGERYVVPLLKKGNRFPLLDKLKLAVPLYCTQTNAAFVCQSVGLVDEKIGYFGLSILWRAAARTWQMFDRATTSVALGSNHLESLAEVPRWRGRVSGRQHRRYRDSCDRLPVPEFLLRSESCNGQSGYRLQSADQRIALPVRGRGPNTAGDFVHRSGTESDLRQRCQRQIVGVMGRHDGDNCTQRFACHSARLGLRYFPEPISEPF